MRGSAFIGRVGGLAVALGIGAAAGSVASGTAWASPEASPDHGDPSVTRSEGPQRPRSARGTGARSAQAGSTRPQGGRTTASGTSAVAPRASSPRNSASVAPPAFDEPELLGRNDSRDLTTRVMIGAATPPGPASASPPEGTISVTPVSIAPAAPVVPVADSSDPVVPSDPPALTAAAVVERSPVGGAVPAGPASSAVSWMVMAAARREFDRLAEPAAAAGVSTDQVSTSVVAAASAQQTAPSFGEIIQYTLFHESATASPTQNPGQSSAGVVTGNLNATTSNGDAMVYAVAQAPTGGVAVVNEDGSYTYTPSRGLAAAGGTDSFQVSIDNAWAYRLTGIAGAIQGVVHALAQIVGLAGPDIVTVTVGVTVAPITEPPTISGVTVDPADTNGTVTGQVTAVDPEGGVLSYGGPTATPKGTFVIDSDTGAFTFTPTAAARHAAAAAGADPSVTRQAVTVTVTDPDGASISREVDLIISPSNGEPLGTPSVGAPNPLSGVVAGAVIGSDPDGDPLTYSVPGATSKGSVSIDAASGSFSYIPTALARDNAAKIGATGADTADTFTVTVTDGHGGAAQIPVTVAVAPTPGPAPTVSFKPGSVQAAEGNTGTTLVPVTVRLSTPFVAPVTVYYSVVEQPLLSTAATPGSDFRQESGSVTIAAGQTEGTFRIAVFGDSEYETDELVRVELTGATNGVVDSSPSNYRNTVTITNDDQPAGAVVSFRPGAVSVAEGNGGSKTVPVTVQLSSASGSPVTVFYSVVEQPLLSTSATAGVDFRQESGSVVIPAGQTEGSFQVTVFGDTAYETDELVRVELTGVSGGTLDLNPSNYRKTVTITNDDQPAGAVVSFRPGAVSVAEGNGGSKTVPVTVQLSSASGSPVTVFYSVVEQPLLSTSATAGVDFRQESGSVVIPAGQTEGSFQVTVFGDTAYETDELVRVELTSVSGGTLDPNPSNYRKTVTITNDDPAAAATQAAPPPSRVV